MDTCRFRNRVKSVKRLKCSWLDFEEEQLVSVLQYMKQLRASPVPSSNSNEAETPKAPTPVSMVSTGSESMVGAPNNNGTTAPSMGGIPSPSAGGFGGIPSPAKMPNAVPAPPLYQHQPGGPQMMQQPSHQQQYGHMVGATSNSTNQQMPPPQQQQMNQMPPPQQEPQAQPVPMHQQQMQANGGQPLSPKESQGNPFDMF